MTDDEITNVSAWLIAQRPATPGASYPNAKPAPEMRGEAKPKAADSKADKKP
jgi:hypothetical protein